MPRKNFLRSMLRWSVESLPRESPTFLGASRFVWRVPCCAVENINPRDSDLFCHEQHSTSAAAETSKVFNLQVARMAASS